VVKNIVSIDGMGTLWNYLGLCLFYTAVAFSEVVDGHEEVGVRFQFFPTPHPYLYCVTVSKFLGERVEIYVHN
jgi:hypothetical protein